jgi:hypothetical protein
MPKENTHLLFAYGLLEEFQGREILRDISSHPWHYLLGSVIPDTFYYGGSASLRRISESFHGKDGNPTNATILEVLESPRSHKDLAFILGFISHCALDITFHPIIYYLCGNYYDESPEKRNRASTCTVTWRPASMWISRTPFGSTGSSEHDSSRGLPLKRPSQKNSRSLHKD